MSSTTQKAATAAEIKAAMAAKAAEAYAAKGIEMPKARAKGTPRMASSYRGCKRNIIRPVVVSYQRMARRARWSAIGLAGRP